MIWGIIFWLLFLSATLYILIKGSRPMHLAIGIMVFGVVATTIAYVTGSHKWLPMNITVLIIDLMALLLFSLLAYVSRAFWPLLLVAWQLATVIIHIASLFAHNLMPNAYGIGQGIWAYLQFATIFGATVIEQQRATRHS